MKTNETISKGDVQDTNFLGGRPNTTGWITISKVETPTACMASGPGSTEYEGNF